VGAENDLWSLDIDLETKHYFWKEWRLKGAPKPRDCHTANFTNLGKTSDHFRGNLLVIFGGTDSEFGYLNEICVLNVDGLFSPKKLITLAMNCVIKNARAIIAQHHGFENFFSLVPEEIREHFSHQLVFLDQKYNEKKY